MIRLTCLVVTCLQGGLPSMAQVKGDASGIQFFEKRVRPLLLEQCGSCHGADKQKGHLRLDSPQAIVQGGESGGVIEPGFPDKSRLIQAVQYAREDLKMPPKAKLSDAQISDLIQWVKQGAPMPTAPESSPAPVSRKEFKVTDADRSHWAFRPVRRPEVPVSGKTGASPIDAFIEAGLTSRGLVPNPRAGRLELIRRATFDLTGLPPTPEEVEAFVNDDSPLAWESLIDRLLDSPHYGEKWGRHWLDLVRFAESNSYERDGAKPHAWRYRDYVIRSFNEDKPYDRFLKEQLAGDEFVEPDADAIIATGYYRLGIWDDEPADRELARYDSLDDIVATTGQVMLGLTVDCARCHDHKIDPFPQRDYYRLLGFFQNVNHYRNGGATDELPIFRSAAEKREHEQQVREREIQKNRLQAQISDFENLFRSRLEHGDSAEPPDLQDIQYRFYRDTWESLPDFSMLKFEERGVLTNGLFELMPRTRDIAFGFVFDAVLVVPADGEYSFHLDCDDGARLSLRGAPVLNYDGQHTLGKEQVSRIRLSRGLVPIRLEYFQKEKAFGLNLAWSGPGFQKRPLSSTHGAKSESPKARFDKLLTRIGPRVLGKEAWANFSKLREELEQLKNAAPAAERALAVTESGPTPAETFVLLRGNPNLKGDRVEPGFPAVFGGGDPPEGSVFPRSGSTGRRSALASWIASPENPLTARVIVNRLWQHHFGRGIVRSPNNFGLQGDRPTHPELLDWLASELVAQGWRLKALHRLMMTSEAYQRSSKGREAELLKDPANNQFWRFEIRRLTAEEIRDTILSVAGNLNKKMHGPGVFVEIPKEVLAGQSAPGSGWGKSSQEEQSRRSIYIHVKRSLITPILESFDVAETDRSAPVRFATVQPTQALSMLNGDFLEVQSKQLAGRLRRECGNDAAVQVRRALRLATGRIPSVTELQRGTSLIESLIRVDGLPPDAALQQFCLLVLNLNEMVFLD